MIEQTIAYIGGLTVVNLLLAYYFLNKFRWAAWFHRSERATSSPLLASFTKYTFILMPLLVTLASETPWGLLEASVASLLVFALLNLIERSKRAAWAARRKLT